MDPIETLTAKQECADIAGRYARAVNERDVEGFVNLFTPDGAWNRPGAHSMVGHDQIREFIEYALPDPAVRTLRHVNGTVLIELIDDDTASSWSQTVVYDVTEAPPYPVSLPGPDMMVEYRDRLVRTADGWRIAQRDTTVVFAASEIPRPKEG
jgi:uncharacterized protein (TIGR02246 family)